MGKTADPTEGAGPETERSQCGGQEGAGRRRDPQGAEKESQADAEQDRREHPDAGFGELIIRSA